MAQRVKALTAIWVRFPKPTENFEGDNQLHRVILWTPQAGGGMCAVTYIHTNAHTQTTINNNSSKKKEYIQFFGGIKVSIA